MGARHNGSVWRIKLAPKVLRSTVSEPAYHRIIA